MKQLAIVLLVSSWASCTFAEETVILPGASTTNGTEGSRWGFVGAPNVEWKYASVPIDPASDIGELPQGQIYATSREKVMHYRFPVPDGLCKIRVHFLQAVGGTNKNNGGLSVVANGKTLAENPEVYIPAISLRSVMWERR